MWEAHVRNRHLWALHRLQVEANFSEAPFITSGPSGQLAFHTLTASGVGQLQTPGLRLSLQSLSLRYTYQAF